MLKPMIMLAFMAALAATPALAEPLPRPEQIVEPFERPLLARLREATSGGPSTNATTALASLDAILPDLKQPTRFRGVVQFFRAAALAHLDRPREAREAIGESVRLLPTHSAPLLVASQIHAFDDDPATGADYLLRAAQIDPPIVNRLSEYEVGNLFRRLGERDDRRREIALSERLLAVGWSRGGASMTSRMALDVLDARIESGDVAGAAALVPKINAPLTFHALRNEKKYDALRPTIDAWAGPRLEKQWAIYLQQARAEWEASRDLRAGHRYAGALAAAGHDATLVATFVPLFLAPLDAGRDDDLILLASTLGNALARLGRWDEVYQAYDAAIATWPGGSSAQAINLTANKGRMLVMQGRFAEGLALFDASLKDAAKFGGQVNSGAIAAIHLYRACALDQLGRGDGDVVSAAIVASRRRLNPLGFANLHVCRGDHAVARSAMIEALGSSDNRGDVIAAMQPALEAGFASDFSRTMHERWDALRADPALRAAVEKHGRIDREPANASAPPEAQAGTPLN